MAHQFDYERRITFADTDMAGIVFRYRTNRHYYLFGLRGGDTAFLTLRLPLEESYRQAEWKDLATAGFDYDATLALGAGGGALAWDPG